ncbi:MAG TPA: hypothetical protein VL371_00655 [Gemmataceae bacterium]|jgi:hypothetical protein|nr:hypothetical protein [Gemmataceae bacterium]
MRKLKRLPVMIAVAVAMTACPAAAADNALIPPQLSKSQQENLLRFLQQHEKPDRYVPPDAKVVSSQPGVTTVPNVETTAGKQIKQYTVQITPHRPVPGQEEIKNVDVYYYRPNPEKGKPGITVKHTVDVTTGNAVGQTEVLLNHHTAMSRDELAEAVALAQEKSAEVKALYQGRDKTAVRWEYLQMLVSRKTEQSEPGDRVVRFVFTAAAIDGQAPPNPVAVLVNLTKETVSKDNG